MKNYIYNTDIGTFEIRQKGHLLYQLWIEEELLGEYASAELAATDVANLIPITWHGTNLKMNSKIFRPTLPNGLP